MKIFKSGGKNILSITRSEWIEMGKVFGKISSVSYQSPTGITFYDGGSFSAGRAGKAKVISIDLNNKVMNVQFENGENAIMDMDTLETVTNLEEHKKAKEEAIAARERERLEQRDRQGEITKRKEERKQRIQNLFNSENKSFFVMGFIAANGSITAQVPRDQVPQFEAMYQKMKGVLPKPESYEVANVESKWSNQLRIHMPMNKVDEDVKSLMESLGLVLRETPPTNPVTYDINDTSYVKNLLGLGFDMGGSVKQNVDLIESNIEKTFGKKAAEDFVEGYIQQH